MLRTQYGSESILFVDIEEANGRCAIANIATLAEGRNAIEDLVVRNE